MEEVLLSKTRIRILKLLRERKMILSEIAKKLKLSKSTVHEHLRKLEEAGFIKRIDDGHKWIYFELTEKGISLFHPSTKRMTLLFTLALISLCIGVYQISFLFRPEVPLAKSMEGRRFVPNFITILSIVIPIGISVLLFFFFFKLFGKTERFR